MSADTPSSSILARVQKLLALASSPNEHEAALALQRAHELMRKHNLDAAALEALGSSPPPAVVKEPYLIGSSFVWKKRLAQVVAQANYCKALSVSRSFYLIGRSDNVAVAKSVLDWLLAALESLVLYARARGEIAPGTTARNNYLHGAVSRLAERFAALRQEADAERDASTALVLVREKEVDAFLDVHYPRRRTVRPRLSRGDRSAFEAGFAAGDAVALTPRRGIGSTKSSLPSARQAG